MQQGIAYELIEYAVDESDLSAMHVAEQLGEDVDAVFKTIVLEGDKTKHFVCVVPGACEVDTIVINNDSKNKKMKKKTFSSKNTCRNEEKVVIL